MPRQTLWVIVVPHCTAAHGRVQYHVMVLSLTPLLPLSTLLHSTPHPTPPSLHPLHPSPHPSLTPPLHPPLTRSTPPSLLHSTPLTPPPLPFHHPSLHPPTLHLPHPTPSLTPLLPHPMPPASGSATPSGIDAMMPSSQEDFVKFEEALSKKILQFQVHTHIRTNVHLPCAVSQLCGNFSVN